MKPPNAAERRHLDKVRALPCLVCGRWGVHAHHVVSDGFQRLTKNHMRVVPLCPDCHTDGPHAVHKLSHGAFCVLHDVDLMAEAERLADGANS